MILELRKKMYFKVYIVCRLRKFFFNFSKNKKLKLIVISFLVFCFDKILRILIKCFFKIVF